MRRLPEEPERVCIRDCLGGDVREAVDDAGSLEEGFGEGEGCDVARIVGEIGVGR